VDQSNCASGCRAQQQQEQQQPHVHNKVPPGATVTTPMQAAALTHHKLGCVTDLLLLLLLVRLQILPCSKAYPHNWSACPFVHQAEKARRRDPRIHRYKPLPCPFDKKVRLPHVRHRQLHWEERDGRTRA
jgi:hypothetical protein